MTRALLAVTLALAGTGFGLVYFGALQRAVALCCAGRGRLLPAMLSLGRWGGAALFFGAAAKLGALPLLASLLGFLAARALALRSARSAC